MARGWESKSVESQMESAAQEKPRMDGAATEAEKEARRQRDKLLLSRTYVLRQIESAGSERYKETLRKALSDIDRELEKLSSR